jgi:general stress protein 26
MATKLSDPEKRDHVRAMLRSFHTAMLVTHALDGQLRSRPVAISESRNGEPLYFSTAIYSEKVAEVTANPHVNVVLQNRRRFVSLTGTARVVTDRALIGRLWAESWRIWFPDGRDDPSLCLLAVEPAEATYWDAEGARGLKYLFEMVRAYVTDKRPDSDSDERHTAHVTL